MLSDGLNSKATMMYIDIVSASSFIYVTRTYLREVKLDP